MEPESHPTATTATTAPEPVLPEPVRRGRGGLEAQVKQVCDRYVLAGATDTLKASPLTPHRIAKAIQEASGAEKPPSTGAVSDVLKRWVRYGYAAVNEGPFSFADYTAAGRSEGLAALKDKYREATKAAKPEASEPAPSAPPLAVVPPVGA